MNPWQQKEQIDLALSMADRNGFRLDASRNYGGLERICLFTIGANEHDFANGVALEVFSDWQQAIAFFAGWEKRELAYEMERGKK